MRAVEHDDPGLGERARQVARPVGLPVVVAEHRDDRDREVAARVGDDARPRRPGRAASGRRRAGSGRPAPRHERTPRGHDPARPRPHGCRRLLRRDRSSPCAGLPRFALPLTGTDGSMPSDANRQRPARRDEARRRHAARPRDRVRARGRPGVYARGGPESGHDVDFMLRRGGRRARAAVCSATRASAASARPRTGSSRSTTRTTR